jgi:hypothetical protein
MQKSLLYGVIQLGFGVPSAKTIIPLQKRLEYGVCVKKSLQGPLM